MLGLVGPPALAEPWKFRESVDEMSGVKSQFWSLRSASHVALPFPYEGQTFATLTVRRSGKAGRPEVLFYVDRGQLQCYSTDCSVRVRFDDKPPAVFSAGGAASGRSDLIFIENVSRFLQSATGAKEIKVEAPFYNVGKLIFSFKPDAPLSLPPR